MLAKVFRWWTQVRCAHQFCQMKQEGSRWYLWPTETCVKCGKKAH